MAWKKIRAFVQIAEAHHKTSLVKRGERDLGITLTFSGWLALALYTVLFQNAAVRFHTSKSLFVNFCEFSILHFSMTFFFFFLCLSRGRNNTKPDHSIFENLKCKQPKWVFWRAFFAIISFWSYSLSRIWTDVGDSSSFYSLDTVWIMLFLAIAGIKFRFIAWIGVFLGGGAIILNYFLFFSNLDNFISAFFGIVSGITLAVITIQTSYMIQREHTSVIGFYHALLGCVGSAVIALICGFVEGFSSLNASQIVLMLISGFVFGFVLYSLIKAFMFTESYVVGGISFLLPVFTDSFNFLIAQQVPSVVEVFSSIFITIGAILIIVSPRRHIKSTP